jgi:hypothetical protein
MPTIKSNASSVENFWRKLPSEIQEEVLNHIPSPTDALSLSATDHANHSLVVGALRYWAPHGVVRPPIASNAAPEMWASQAKRLSREAKKLLPYLEKPLDLTSRSVRSNFSHQAIAVHVNLRLAESFNGNVFFPITGKAVERPDELSEKSGVVFAVDATEEEIVQEDRHERLAGLVGATEESLIRAETLAEKAGFKLPPLSNETRASYLESIGIRRGQISHGATDSEIRSVWRSLYPSVVASFE